VQRVANNARFFTALERQRWWYNDSLSIQWTTPNKSNATWTIKSSAVHPCWRFCRLLGFFLDGPGVWHRLEVWWRAMRENTNLVCDLLHVRMFGIFLTRSACIFVTGYKGGVLTGRLAGLVDSSSSREIVRFTCCVTWSFWPSNSPVSESSFTSVSNGGRSACRGSLTTEWLVASCPTARIF